MPFGAASDGCDVMFGARSVLDATPTGAPTRALLIGDREQDVGVAGLIEWAVAGEVASAPLLLGVVDRDSQPAGQ